MIAYTHTEPADILIPGVSWFKFQETKRTGVDPMLQLQDKIVIHLSK